MSKKEKVADKCNTSLSEEVMCTTKFEGRLTDLSKMAGTG
jgi:hypothetical protein